MYMHKISSQYAQFLPNRHSFIDICSLSATQKERTISYKQGCKNTRKTQIEAKMFLDSRQTKIISMIPNKHLRRRVRSADYDNSRLNFEF